METLLSASFLGPEMAPSVLPLHFPDYQCVPSKQLCNLCNLLGQVVSRYNSPQPFSLSLVKSSAESCFAFQQIPENIVKLLYVR